MISVAVIVFALVGATFADAAGLRPHLPSLRQTVELGWARVPCCSAALAQLPGEHSFPVIFEFLAVALMALIPWGSGADRWRLTAGIASSAILAALVFPLLAHWVWGGWLAQLGANFSLGAGFLDGGGAATVHVLGGLCALAVVWIAGPRKGKFPKEGLSTAMPGPQRRLCPLRLPCRVGRLAGLEYGRSDLVA